MEQLDRNQTTLSPCNDSDGGYEDLTHYQALGHDDESAHDPNGNACGSAGDAAFAPITDGEFLELPLLCNGGYDALAIPEV